MNRTVEELLNDPKVFEAWRFYGTHMRFEHWVARMVLEYGKRKVDVYA
jgi:hypothetical protein